MREKDIAKFAAQMEHLKPQYNESGAAVCLRCIEQNQEGATRGNNNLCTHESIKAGSIESQRGHQRRFSLLDLSLRRAGEWMRQLTEEIISCQEASEFIACVNISTAVSVSTRKGVGREVLQTEAESMTDHELAIRKYDSSLNQIIVVIFLLLRIAWRCSQRFQSLASRMKDMTWFQLAYALDSTI
jgi:hypothetical protein